MSFLDRPRPSWWFYLPEHVIDGASLAAHLRERAGSIADDDPVGGAILEVAELVERCPPRDARCLQAVAAALDARAADTQPGGVEPGQWETLAHAVDRVAYWLGDDQ